jgi:hypothetical protein
MAVIVVSGAVANKPMNGGAAWTRLSWALGLRQLGHDVYFFEQIAPGVCVDSTGAACAVERSVNLAYFTHVMKSFAFEGKSALVRADDRQTAGLSWTELEEIADAAALLVNISGHLSFDPLKARFRTRAFVDLDPGYTQFWHAQRLAEPQLRDHHHYFTIGENIGQARCTIPAGDIPWRPIRQPVVLNEWPVAPHKGAAFTTVASWRGPYGRVAHDGHVFGVKAHEFRTFAALPARTGQAFEIALDVHPADRRDVERLQDYGWTLQDPQLVAGDPATFRQYVQESAAEFSVAQGIYVETQSGWFSDRTTRYLASGKPVLVQDTGFSRAYPVGLGLVTFRTLDEAACGVRAIASDYDAHSRAARAIATEYFDSDKVLRTLLGGVGGAV